MTTARAGACLECPDSHEQYLLLLKSTVTHVVLRVPERKDTLGHLIRVCLAKFGPFRCVTFPGGKMTLPPFLNGRRGVICLGEQNGTA